MIIRHPSGKLLMQLRDDGKGEKIWFPNTWCFPGGTKEPDEGFLQTTIREAAEEFELKLSPEDCKEILIFNYDGTEDTHVFLCSVGVDQEPVLKEGADVKWMNMTEIEKLPLAFGQNRILSTIKETLERSELQRPERLR